MQTVYMVVITGEYKAGDGRSAPAHRTSIAAIRSSKAEADAVLLNNRQVGPKWIGAVEYVDSGVIDGEPNFE